MQMSQQPDEPDGGPPITSRYITEQTCEYRLPSMELQSPLIYDPKNFRKYLIGALDDGNASIAAHL